MFRKFIATFFAVVLLFNCYGCALFLVGAGAAGGVVWIEGKIQEEISLPIARVTAATRKALKALKLTVTKVSEKETVSQFVGNYTDGRNFWVDLHKTTENKTLVEIRVGVTGDREESQKILDKIKRYI